MSDSATVMCVNDFPHCVLGKGEDPDVVAQEIATQLKADYRGMPVTVLWVGRALVGDRDRGPFMHIHARIVPLRPDKS